MSGVLGKYRISADTASIADGDSIASYLVDSAGNLLTSTLIGGAQRLDVNLATEFLEDAAHSSGDRGQFILAVRHDANTSMVSADGDYAPLQVDADGKLKVAADLTVASDFVYAEDSAAASGDLGAFILAVRQDSLASSTSADGDYGAFKQTASGELYVHDAGANSTLTSILADTATIDSNLALIQPDIAAILVDTGSIDTNVASILSEVQALSLAEDSASAGGEMGIQMLAVRNDADAVLTSADLDFSAIAVDSAGRVKITGSVSASISGTFAEDSAHSSGDIGMQILGVRKDANGSNVSADGDYASFLFGSAGDLKVVDRADGSNLQQIVTVGTSAVALPASSLSGRKHILIQNQASASIYLGSASVTASGATKGIEIPKGGFWEGDVGPGNVVYGIAGSAGNSVAVWELA